MGIKDKIISAAVEKYLKSYLEDLGELKEFDMDTVNKNINVKINLIGEPDTFQLNIYGYEFTERNGKTFMEIKDIHASKKWMNIAFRKYIKNKMIEIPEAYSKWVEYIA